MNESKRLSISMTTRELILGWLYVPIQLVFLVPLLNVVFRSMNWSLDTPTGVIWFNFAFWVTNFLATILIYHRFLWQSFSHIRKHFVGFVEAVVLGLVMYQVMGWIISFCIQSLGAVYPNRNDASIAYMARVNPAAIRIGTIFLAPIAEEAIFRGLIFRGLFQKSRLAAYLTSTFLFSFLHIYGYIGIYTPTEILIHTLDYLPAGIALGWTYEKADTILGPILMHTIINAVAFSVLT